MSSLWVRSFLLGIAASAVGPVLWVSGAVVLTDYALVGVFVVGPAHQTVTALAALRRSANPIRRVLHAGAAYWAAASIGLAVGWNQLMLGERPFMFTVQVLVWSWAMATAFSAVIATVTGSVYAWRVRS